MAPDPRRVAEIHVKLKVKNEGYDGPAMEVLKNTAIHCPVAKSLHPDLVQSLEIDFV
jgi:uncharacterized OsmC-like protein